MIETCHGIRRKKAQIGHLLTLARSNSINIFAVSCPVRSWTLLETLSFRQRKGDLREFSNSGSEMVNESGESDGSLALTPQWCTLYSVIES